MPLIDEAVADLRKRRILARDEFDQLDYLARRKAFTVAHVESQATLGKIHQAVTQAVAEGSSLRLFRGRVEEALDEGTILSRPHMETVFRTNVQQAYSNGMDQLLARDLIGKAFPYEETLPIRDSRLTDLCAICSRSGIQGTAIFRRDDPTWDRIKPPRHWSCRCGRNMLTLEQAAAKGIREAIRWLETGTPPVQPGWVPMPRLPAAVQRQLDRWLNEERSAA